MVNTMNNITNIFFCSIIAITLAMSPPAWYPKNAENAIKKCNDESHIATGQRIDIYTDTPELRDFLLCKVKATNVYTENEGFHLDRMAYLFFYEPEKNSNDPVLQDCVNKNKDISSHSERVYKTFRCLADLEKNSKNNA